MKNSDLVLLEKKRKGGRRARNKTSSNLQDSLYISQLILSTQLEIFHRSIKKDLHFYGILKDA